MNKDMNGKIQLEDNFVKSLKINVHNGSKNIENAEMQLNIGVLLNERECNNKEQFLAEIVLNIDVEILKDNKKIISISTIMLGLFSGDKSLKKAKFLDMVKYNGTPNLYQILRAYIISVSALSMIEPIRIPMVNFYEYFEKANTNKNGKKENEKS